MSKLQILLIVLVALVAVPALLGLFVQWLRPTRAESPPSINNLTITGPYRRRGARSAWFAE